MSHTKKPTIEKIILALLGLLALAALVRTMFLGLEIDEEYALSLGFRLVRGDRLFYSMWEPHQLAALPPALLIGLFTAVAGTTTGVLLFVRGTVLAVKLALAVWFYRSLRGALGGRCAYLLALAVLAFTPKWFLGPDYVSQQFHFTLCKIRSARASRAAKSKPMPCKTYTTNAPPQTAQVSTNTQKPQHLSALPRCGAGRRRDALWRAPRLCPQP